MNLRSDDDREVGSAPAGPTLPGTDDEALLQALRNVWPILSLHSRRQATNTANYLLSLQRGS